MAMFCNYILYYQQNKLYEMREKGELFKKKPLFYCHKNG